MTSSPVGKRKWVPTTHYFWTFTCSLCGTKCVSWCSCMRRRPCVHTCVSQQKPSSHRAEGKTMREIETAIHKPISNFLPCWCSRAGKGFTPRVHSRSRQVCSLLLLWSYQSNEAVTWGLHWLAGGSSLSTTWQKLPAFSIVLPKTTAIAGGL